MKSFLIALAFIGCAVFFSHAAVIGDGYATGYVQDYNELLAELQAEKANIASASAKQAIQKLYDDIKDLLSWLRQQDAEQISITGSKIPNDLDALESQLTGNQSFKQLVHEVSTKIRQLQQQQMPLAQYADGLNNIFRDFKNKLYQILGGC